MHRRTLARLRLALLAPLAALACNGGEGTSDTAGGDCAAALVAGGLVITELMPDPAGSDSTRVEWLELYNPSDAPVDLQGVGLIYSSVGVPIDDDSVKGHLIMDAVEIPARSYMTFGAALNDSTRPPYVGYGYAADLGSMSNSSGRLRVMCGDVVVDDFSYDALKIADGVSTIFDGAVDPDSAVNDNLTAWCLSPTDVEAYSTGEFGSPGEANPVCPPPQPATGQCYENESLRDVVAPAPGQLVITEMMPNAGKTDMTVGEWFEVLVVDGGFDLNGLQLGANTTKFATDPTDPDQTVVEPQCVRVAAGDVLLFSEQPWTETDVVIDFSLVDSASDSNPNPGVYLAWNGEILDEAHYSKPKDGVAFSLDPKWTTPADNDDPAHFCLADQPFAEGDFGTPGFTNPTCPPQVGSGECVDPDTAETRPTVPPAPGQLLITELMPNAGLTDATVGEWFEVLVTGGAFDLNGLQLGANTTAFAKDPTDPDQVVSVPECLRVAAGDVVLFSEQPWTETDVVIKFGLIDSASASNPNPGVYLAWNGEILDEVHYTKPANGVAFNLDPQWTTPADNDDPTHFCPADQPFAEGDLGTPGLVNPECPATVGPDECLDPNTGEPRKRVPPAPGQLAISEVMADPSAKTDPKGEWFELFVTADVDLNGLEIGKAADSISETITQAECLRAESGSWIALTRKGGAAVAGDPLDNGGIEAPFHEYTKLSLSNTGGNLWIGIGGAELDQLAYGTAPKAASTQVDPTAVDPTLNDVPENRCPATAAYGLGDLGTPGAMNAACGGGGGATCIDPNTDEPRPITSPAPGDLVITEFMADPSAVTDTAGEWFEVFAAKAVDLNGLKMLAKAAPTAAEIAAAKGLESDTCVTVLAGEFALIARNADPAQNGGLQAVDAVTTVSLGNATGGLALALGDQLLDAIGWAAAQKAGKSTQLAPAVKDPAMNDNAAAAPWCTAAGAGTPKQENVACP